MATFAGVMTVLSVIQMFVGVISPAIKAATQSKAIQQNIDEVNTQTDDIKQQFDQLAKDITKVDIELQEKTQSNIEKLTQLNASILVAKNNINTSEKLIQMFGIIFICIIFFALLVKEFDLLSGLF